MKIVVWYFMLNHITRSCLLMNNYGKTKVNPITLLEIETKNRN